jgi:hypothetical protein
MKILKQTNEILNQGKTQKKKKKNKWIIFKQENKV